jgi:hypothetical protein
VEERTKRGMESLDLERLLKLKNRLLKSSSIQYHIFPEEKKWTGWELNPRPQRHFSRLLFTSYLKEWLRKENCIVQIPSAPL